MKALNLIINYVSEAVEPAISLEQEPIAGNSLTTTDLYKMLALARSGVSAKLYRPETCNVSVVDGEVLADLVVYAWTKPLDLTYTLATNYGSVVERVRIKQYREFDFIINLSKKVELPFIVSSISYQKTQLPFFDSLGNVVDEPVITFDDRYVYTDSEVIGVIRVSCVADGFSNTVSLSFTKEDQSIDSVNITLSSTFYNSSGSLLTEATSLKLPGCLELLLSTCENELLTEKTHGKVEGEDKDKQIPVVYYSDCDGSFLAVRYENP